MTIFDLYSKRQKRLRGDIPDVYSYDEIPHPLRVQIVQIWRESLGNKADYNSSTFQVMGAYKFIVESLRREYGMFTLVGNRRGQHNYLDELVDFFLSVEDTEKVLDVIELSFRWIDKLTRNFDYRYKRSNQ